MEQLVIIELFGLQYTFRTESEISKAREAADYLAKEVAAVESTPTLGSTSNLSRIAVLTIAALNIANEYFELKRSHAELLRVLSQKSSDISTILDGVLKAGSPYKLSPNNAGESNAPGLSNVRVDGARMYR